MYTVKLPLKIYSILEMWLKNNKAQEFHARRWSPANPSIHQVQFKITAIPDDKGIVQFHVITPSTLDFTKHNSKNGWYV